MQKEETVVATPPPPPPSATAVTPLTTETNGSAAADWVVSGGEDGQKKRRKKKQLIKKKPSPEQEQEKDTYKKEFFSLVSGSEEEERRWMEKIERREEQASTSCSGTKVAVATPAVSTQQLLTAIQQKVDASDPRSVFDSIDDNLSGRVSAEELSKALVTMQINIDEAKAEELIKRINERFNSKRKALTYDVFCQAFAKGTVHGRTAARLAASVAKSSPAPKQKATCGKAPAASPPRDVSPMAPAAVSFAPSVSFAPTASKVTPTMQRPPPTPPAPQPAWMVEILIAIQQKVDASDPRTLFDSIDENLSGRVSAEELSKALNVMQMQVAMDEAKAEELIKRINEKFKSKRKALTYDVFCQAFAKGTVHGERPTWQRL